MDFRRKLLAGGCRFLALSGAGRLMAPWTQGNGLIFTLHNVLPDSEAHAFRPNAHLDVTPDFLDSTIRQVKQAGLEFVTLDEALRRTRDEERERRFAVLTFDDGYRNNLVHAYPVLKRHCVPFTIFVATGFVDRTSEIWWVALERILEKADYLDMPIGARMVRLPTRTTAEKCSAYGRAALWLAHDMSEAAQRLEIRRMARAYGIDMEALAEELILDWGELAELAGDPLAEIGAHTHDHLALARLAEDEMRDNIQLGLDRLKAELDLEPRHFAYPYGYEAAVDRRSAETIGRFGFDCALTTRPGMMRKGLQEFALPRVSLNGHFQSAAIVSQYITGAPFPLYNAWRTARERLTPGGEGMASATRGTY
ncbi:polysaccharide deacetylase family protein [Stappia sp. GBMRC 2046]|uniref:Chitooligosaccharide deacetylase n=1 Tax=Stappia sediminis TaxID=2692190 RepID=A0A7X3S9X6_9HYPH|nr:polysaccharide deacetylase family protein [Stappia sediminis]MXN67304.1 polysaccharide deacetylase family protein [Stappia sediminis]